MSKKVSIKTPKKPPEDKETWVNSREGIKRLTFDLPISLHTKLKIYSAKTNQTMGEIINGLLEEALKN